MIYSTDLMQSILGANNKSTQPELPKIHSFTRLKPQEFVPVEGEVHIVYKDSNN